MVSRLSPQRRRFVLVLVATLAVAGVAGGTALLASREDPAARPADEPPTVLLLHGLGGDPTNMSTVEAALRRLGRRTVNLALPSNGLVSIGESVRAVEQAVRASGAAAVDLVGYSLGGVVARAWVATESDSAEARHVVTLGAPHHGAQLAETAAVFLPDRCVDACAELRPGSQFLRDLNADDETPGDAEWTSVWTALDRTVTPPESSVLDGAVNVRLQDVCPDSRVGHGSINRDPLPVGLVVLALTDSLPSTLDASDCGVVRAAAA